MTKPKKPLAKPAAKSPVKPVEKAPAKPAPAAKAPVKAPGKVTAKVTAKGGDKAAVKPVVTPIDPAAAEAAKTIMLNARKRKSTPTIFKIKSRRNTPIVFTLDDVQELINTRKTEKEKPAVKKVGDTKAAFLAAKQIHDKVSPPKGKTPSPLPKMKSRVLGAASLADILGVTAPPKSQKAISITQLMDNENIAPKFRRYYKQLVEMREQIRQGLDLHTSETLKRSSKEDSGDLSGYSQHMADAGTDTFDRDLALSLVSSEQELLYEIEEALKRIRAGTYGVCEITSQTISPDRLNAVPFTRYSLDGQKELEKQRRYGVQRNNAVGLFGEATSEDAAALAEDDSDSA